MILRRSRSDEKRQLNRSFATPKLAIGAVAFCLGFTWVALDSLGWYYSQQSLALYAQASLLRMVAEYYLSEGIAIGVLIGGVYLVYRALLSGRFGAEPSSIRAIMANALSSKRDVQLGIVAAVAYAVIYAVVSSIVVFQPGVDFATTYGVTAPGWNAAACCGAPGTVPALILYLAPQAHVAFQILPLDALFVILVPVLVGLNVTVAAYAVRSSQVRNRARWVGSIGVLTGLFTGCPTCAGAFLAGAVGGFGATTLAVALAPYQILFVVISIPLLLVSPLVTSLSIRRSMLAACPVPDSSPN
jgi:hypothetical protein